MHVTWKKYSPAAAHRLRGGLAQLGNVRLAKRCRQTWPWVRVEPLGTIFFCPGYHPEQFLLGRVSSIKNLNGNSIT